MMTHQSPQYKNIIKMLHIKPDRFYLTPTGLYSFQYTITLQPFTQLM